MQYIEDLIVSYETMNVYNFSEIYTPRDETQETKSFQYNLIKQRNDDLIVIKNIFNRIRTS